MCFMRRGLPRSAPALRSTRIGILGSQWPPTRGLPAQLVPLLISPLPPLVRHAVRIALQISDSVGRRQYEALGAAINPCLGWHKNAPRREAVQPLAWQLPYALEVTEGLFKDGPQTRSGKGWSMFGGVQIADVAAMQAAFASHFIASYDHGIWALDWHEPEAGTGP